MSWKYEDLWLKAKLYMARASAVGPDDELFPFWSSLALEFLARASLAKVHPSLLADPSQGGTSVMYACGLVNPGSKPHSPKSIPAHTVFERCKAAVPGFTAEHEATCLALSEKRNSELHTGEPAFVGYQTSEWQAKFYRVCKLLVAQQGEKLESLLGDVGLTKAAEEMIAAEDRTEVRNAKKAVGIAKATFEKLDKEEQDAKRIASRPSPYLPTGSLTRDCPACAAVGILVGSSIHVAESRLEDDYIVSDVTYLPASFRCASCGLLLQKYAQLDAVGLGGQFVAQESQEASEYYGTSSDERYEEEYGND